MNNDNKLASVIAELRYLALHYREAEENACDRNREDYVMLYAGRKQAYWHAIGLLEKFGVSQ